METEAQGEETEACGPLASCLKAWKLCFPSLNTSATASCNCVLQIQNSVNCSRNPRGSLHPVSRKRRGLGGGQHGFRFHRGYLPAGSLGGRCLTALSLIQKSHNISQESSEGPTALHGDIKASRSACHRGGPAKCKFLPPIPNPASFHPNPSASRFCPGLSLRTARPRNPCRCGKTRNALGWPAMFCTAVFMFAIKASRCWQFN